MVSPEASARWRGVVGLVVLIGLVLRLVHLDFGLPGAYHPDEIGATGETARWLAGHPELHHYNHPPLLKNIAYVLLLARGAFSQAPPTAATVVLALRWVSALSGAATVLAVYLLALHFVRPRLALLAAALQAVLPLTVVSSMYGVPDTLQGFLFVAGLVSALGIHDRPTSRGYVLAGLSLSLAVGAKYLGGLLLLPLAIAHVLAARRARSAGEKLPRRWALKLAAGAGAGLAASFPLLPFELKDVWRDLWFEAGHLLVDGHHGYKVSGRDYGLVYHLGHSVLPAAGPALLAAIVAGLVLMAVRRGPKDVILLAGVVPYYLIVEWAYLVPPVPERYVLPLIGPYLVAAIVALDALCTRIRQPPRALAAGAAAAVAFLAWPVLRTVSVLDGMGSDTRAQMQAWMAEHLARGAVVAVDGGRTYYPDPLGVRYASGDVALQGTAPPRTRYVLTSSLAYDRYLDHPEQVPAATAYYADLFANGSLLHEAAASRRYLIHNPTLRLYELP